MSKPLLGGSVAAAVLLSASLLFLAQTSIAEPLAEGSQQTQHKGVNETADPANSDKDRRDAADTTATEAAIENSEPEAESEASSPAVTFTATAYSLRGRTASGRAVGRGLIAADRRVLPIGTLVRLEAGSYSGEYIVADTGGAVRGRKIDIWVPNTSEAMRFGRRPIKLTVLTRTRSRTKTPRGQIETAERQLQLSELKNSEPPSYVTAALNFF